MKLPAGAATTVQWPPRIQAWGWTVLIVMLFGLGLRVAYYHGFTAIPDEDIVFKVVAHLRLTGDWDTNWAKADLPPDLRYDQYNFSSHMYGTFFFYRFIKLIPGLLEWRSREDGLAVYRMFTVLLATLAIWQALQLGRRVGGMAVALGAAALTAVSSQLVEDAHYIRPEAFTTVLTLGAVALSWPREKISAGRILGAALLIGLLVATKVSMLALGWVPAAPLIFARGQARARWTLLALLPVGVAAGFVLGAPGAVWHPEKFLNGVHHLTSQYAGMHPPHSHLNGEPVGDILARFYVQTFGWPVLIGAGLGALALLRQQRWAEMALLAGPPLLFAIYFSTRGVFFERNLSHVVPLVFVLTALGGVALAEWLAARSPVPRLACVTVVLLVGVVRPLSLTIPFVDVALSGRGLVERWRFEGTLRDAHPGAPWVATDLLVPIQLDPLRVHFATQSGPILLSVSDNHDEWTAKMLVELDRTFEAKHIADYIGLFPGMPVSTLVAYHSPDSRYFLVTGVREQTK